MAKMNALRKKAAIEKYSGMSVDEFNEQIVADEKAYTEAEQLEIYDALFNGNATATPAPKAPTKFKYPEYDLWKIDVESLNKEDEEGKAPKKVTYRMTAIKKMRSNVKIEAHVAESRNRHSHSSNQRYYPVGSITNGNEELITV